MIHCHDDKQFVILDQLLFLTHVYAHTKDGRQSTSAESLKNLTWRKELFHVERPFRMANVEQTKKKKKKNKVCLFSMRVILSDLPHH
jgi:hypothetical protein